MRLAPLIMILASVGGVGQEPGPPITADLRPASPEVRTTIQEIVAAAIDDPSSAAARGKLAMVYHENGFLTAARGSYLQAEQLDPSEPRWPYHRALLAAHEGRIESAVAVIQKALDLEPDYHPGWMHRGVWLLDLNRLDDSMAAFDEAASRGAGKAASVGKARVLLRRRDAAGARKLLEPLATSASHPYVFTLLGAAYRQLGLIDLARQAMASGKTTTRWIWRDPWVQERSAYQAGFAASLQHAESLLSEGQLARAIERFEELRTRQPGNAALLNNLGIAYTRSNQPEASRRVLQRGLELHPTYYRFHVNLANYYYGKRDNDSAMAHLAEALAINPAAASAHMLVGLVRLDHKAYAPARAAFEASISYDAGNADAFYHLGIIDARQRRWPAAIANFTRAVELKPDFTRAYISLAGCFAELGDFAAANRQLDTAARVGTRVEHVRQARTRVREMERKSR